MKGMEKMVKKYMKTGMMGASVPKGRDKARKHALASAFSKMKGK